MNSFSLKVSGTGQPLILIHGWAMNSGIWYPLLSNLEKYFTVYQVDLPGHGINAHLKMTSPQATLDKLLVQLPKQAIWLGWSLGGHLALSAAIHYSEWVSGLIMMAASPSFVKRNHWPNGKPHALFQQFSEHLKTDRNKTLERFLLLETQGLDKQRARVDEMKNWLQNVSEPSDQGLEMGLKWLAELDYSDQLQQIRCKSLWLGGRLDRLVHPESIRQAAEMTPDSHLLIIAGASHAPFISHPRETLLAMKQFCQVKYKSDGTGS